jgi:exodeoxyribonuclease VII small subunit
MEKKISYTEAISELELIVTEIEQGDITIDTLSEKVKRASELIRICKNKLTAAEQDVNKILGEIKEE